MSGVAIVWRVCSFVKGPWLFCKLCHEVKVVEVLAAVKGQLVICRELSECGLCRLTSELRF